MCSPNAHRCERFRRKAHLPVFPTKPVKWTQIPEVRRRRKTCGSSHRELHKEMCPPEGTHGGPTDAPSPKIHPPRDTPPRELFPGSEMMCLVPKIRVRSKSSMQTVFCCFKNVHPPEMMICFVSDLRGAQRCFQGCIVCPFGRHRF